MCKNNLCLKIMKLQRVGSCTEKNILVYFTTAIKDIGRKVDGHNYGLKGTQKIQEPKEKKKKKENIAN